MSEEQSPGPTPEPADALASGEPAPDASASPAQATNVDATVTAAGEESPAGNADALDSADALDASSLDQASIDELLKSANFEDPSQLNEYSSPAQTAVMPEVEELKLPNFQQVMQDAQVSSVDFLRDVDLHVKIELGRSRMLVEDVLKLGEGSVVELDKLAGDPVDVLVNDRLVARGEVLVLNDNFCVRINEIVAGVKEEGL